MAVSNTAPSIDLDDRAGGLLRLRGRWTLQYANVLGALLRDAPQQPKQVHVTQVERTDSAAVLHLLRFSHPPALDFNAFNFRRLHTARRAPVRRWGSRWVVATRFRPVRPRRWRGALLLSGSVVRFEVLDPDKRPLGATADSHEVRDIVEVTVRESQEHTVTLLFDPEHSLEERILNEQFMA